MYLGLVTGRLVKDHLNGLSLAIKWDIAGNSTEPEDAKFPWQRFATAMETLTFCYLSLHESKKRNSVGIPGVTHDMFRSPTDVTTIWNANGFFEYVITVKVLRHPGGLSRPYPPRNQSNLTRTHIALDLRPESVMLGISACVV